MIPTTNATTAPAITDITSVCSVSALPEAATSTSMPNEPSANAAVVDRELPELAAGDEDSSQGLLQHPRDRGEAEQHRGVAVDAVDEGGQTDRDHGDEPDGDPLRLEQRPAVAGVEPVEDRQRVADPAALDGVDRREDAEQQAERAEPGGAERPQGDEGENE